MKAKGKKLVSLFLVVALMSISCTTMTTQRQKRFGSSKERRGATLIIHRKSDQVKKTQLEGTPWETSVITGIWGELIAVKQNSLLLLDAGGEDVSVDIAEIKVIRIVKKSNVVQGMVRGVAIGGGVGALIGFAAGDDEPGGFFSFTAEGKALIFGIAFGALGLVFGGIAGLTPGKDKTIQIEGKSDLEIEETLDKLRKKARIRDYK